MATLSPVLPSSPNIFPGLPVGPISGANPLPPVGQWSSVQVKNLGDNTVFVAVGGPSVSVTPGTGTPVLPQREVSLPLWIANTTTLATFIAAVTVGGISNITLIGF